MGTPDQSINYVRLLAVWVFGILLYAGDFLVKRIPLPWRPASVEIWVDYYIPFIPFWVWIYLFAWLLFLFGIAGWFLYDNRHNWDRVRQLLLAAVVMQVGAWIIHFVFPTYMPRPELPENLDTASLWLINHIYETDPPTHVLPSLHVASIALVTWFFAMTGETWRLAIRWFIVGVISASIVFTKQHGVIDILGGIAWSYAACHAGVYLGAEWNRLWGTATAASD